MSPPLRPPPEEEDNLSLQVSSGEQRGGWSVWQTCPPSALREVRRRSPPGRPSGPRAQVARSATWAPGMPYPTGSVGCPCLTGRVAPPSHVRSALHAGCMPDPLCMSANGGLPLGHVSYALHDCCMSDPLGKTACWRHPLSHVRPALHGRCMTDPLCMTAKARPLPPCSTNQRLQRCKAAAGLGATNSCTDQLVHTCRRAGRTQFCSLCMLACMLCIACTAPCIVLRVSSPSSSRRPARLLVCTSPSACRWASDQHTSSSA